MTAQPMASLLTGVIPEGFSATPFDGEAATLAFLAEARKRDAIARFIDRKLDFQRDRVQEGFSRRV